ncbi:MAG: monovalent cation/H(+) antiporter subunit G [Eubacteriales bacterium]
MSLRAICSMILILIGVLVFIISAVGNFRFAFVLNRMQISTNADTLGVSSILAGLIVANGMDVLSLKMIVMLLFLWFANPVAGHVLAKTETIVNENIIEECELVRYDDDV